MKCLESENNNKEHWSKEQSRAIIEALISNNESLEKEFVCFFKANLLLLLYIFSALNTKKYKSNNNKSRN